MYQAKEFDELAAPAGGEYLVGSDETWQKETPRKTRRPKCGHQQEQKRLQRNRMAKQSKQLAGKSQGKKEEEEGKTCKKKTQRMR